MDLGTLQGLERSDGCGLKVREPYLMIRDSGMGARFVPISTSATSNWQAQDQPDVGMPPIWEIDANDAGTDNAGAFAV
jgi:hypothetical protein